jgi:hypothetical protein
MPGNLRDCMFTAGVTEEEMMAKIRSVIVEGDRQNGYRRVQVLFGTNYFLEIVDNDGRIEFLLGAHHTGFKADASEIKGELHKYISEVQERHPESGFEQE